MAPRWMSRELKANHYRTSSSDGVGNRESACGCRSQAGEITAPSITRLPGAVQPQRPVAAAPGCGYLGIMRTNRRPRPMRTSRENLSVLALALFVLGGWTACSDDPAGPGGTSDAADRVPPEQIETPALFVPHRGRERGAHLDGSAR